MLGLHEQVPVNASSKARQLNIILCIVVGHEDHGVTKCTFAVCDMVIFLPMYGKGTSMRVHVSLGIVAYYILHAPRIA